jgi:hypothetical protein
VFVEITQCLMAARADVLEGFRGYRGVRKGNGWGRESRRFPSRGREGGEIGLRRERGQHGGRRWSRRERFTMRAGSDEASF